MKICLLTPTFLPKVGGTETALDQLARHLQKLGHWVGVLTQQPRHLTARDEEFPYPVRRYKRPWMLLGHFSGMQHALSRWHQEVGFDVVSAQTAYPAGYAACLWGKKRHVPVVITCRGGDISEDSRFRRRRTIVRRMEWCLDATDGVTVLSENMLPAVQFLAESREPTVIYNGIDASLSNTTEAPMSESWYPSLAGQSFLLAMGRLHPVKGFDALIEAYAKARGRLDPPSRLVIAGAGREEESLRKLIERRGLNGEVVMTGEVMGTAKAWLLQHCRTFVLSSHREGFPMVLLEAMICGRAVLATRCVDRISLVADGKVGALVETGSIEALADELAAINNRRDLSELGNIARERSYKCLWPVIAERYVQLFRTLIEKKL
jgi:glycosyltransferase involved in cell wall biosynthesis